MSSLSRTSITRLQTCHKDIQALVLAVSAEEEVLVVDGGRTLEQQKKNVLKGVSKTLDSKHVINDQRKCSDAVDLMPLPLNWTDYPRIIAFAKRVLKKADELYQEGRITSKFRWGGDWDMDGDWTDEKFRDFVHFERI